jgi:hypothetical protein
MIIKCHYTPDVERPTYLLGHAGTREAILIDPDNDVTAYLSEAERVGLSIRHVFAADYGERIPFGLLELRERPGVQVYQSNRAPFVCDALTLHPEVPITLGQIRVVLVRDALGAESFAVHDLEDGADCLALATWPLAVERSPGRLSA